MKHELSTLELRILVGELNAVRGYYIDQFYQLAEKRFRMKLSSKEGKYNLNIEIPEYIALSDKGEVSEEASGFAMAVRKRVAGAKITNISIINNDRILKFDVERKESKGSMILEMFGKGNLIITDDKMEIDLALMTHEFSDRAVKKGETYKAPRNESADLGDKRSIDRIFELAKDAPGSDKLIAYLSRRLGVGTAYLEDAIKRQGLDPKVKIKDVDTKTMSGIKGHIEKIINGSGQAILYLKDGKPQAVAVAELEKYAELEKTKMPLGQAIEELYSSGPVEVKEERNEDVERIEASIKKQEEIIKQMEIDEAECRIKGEFISANVTSIGNLIKAAGGKKVSDEEIKELAKGFAVKRIDRAKRALIIEKEDSS